MIFQTVIADVYLYNVYFSNVHISICSLQLPAVVAMTKLAATELPLCSEDVVKLDIRTRTPALLVSADHMEVRRSSV